MTPEPTANTARQLIALLQQQLDQVNSYLQFLDAIKRCVSGNDVAQLNQLLTQNTPQPESIEQVRQQQYQLLESCGYSQNESGLRAFINDSKQAGLVEIEQQLTTQLKLLDKALLINGLLIQKNQQRVRQSIQILSGREATGQTSTYSAQGNLDTDSNQKRRLARA